MFTSPRAKRHFRIELAQIAAVSLHICGNQGLPEMLAVAARSLLASQARQQSPALWKAAQAGYAAGAPVTRAEEPVRTNHHLSTLF